MVVSWGGYFDPKDLLQLDGTIIAGILILMTVSAYYEKKFTIKFWGHPREVISLSVIAFGISAMTIIGTGLPNSNETDDFVRTVSIWASGMGFGMLMFGIGMILKGASNVAENDDSKKKKDDANLYHDG